MARRIGSWVATLGWLMAVGCASDPSDVPPIAGPDTNGPPTVGQVTATTEINVPVDIDLVANASDPDNDPLTVTSVFATGNSALVRILPDNRSIEVTPLVQSAVLVSYTLNDGHRHAVDGTVTVNVSAPGHAPTATSTNVAVLKNVPTAIVLVASDPDGPVLTYAIETPPAHGTLSGTAPDLTYTPEMDFVGTDQLGFRVADDKHTSNLAYVTLAVTAENHPPVATSQAVTATEDTTTPITLSGSDADGDMLRFAIVMMPVHGGLIGVAPNLGYVPFANYHGGDNFTFLVSDPIGAVSQVATVSIDVASVNDGPVALPQNRNLGEDQPLAMTLLASDIDDDALSFVIATPPAHGTLTGSPPNVTYQPNANFNGSDAFTFTASDGTAISAPATISLSVGAINDPPIAVDGAVTTDEEVAVNFTLQASDPDGDPLTYTIVSQPADGSLTGVGAMRTYTPKANLSGTRTLTFQAKDINGSFSNLATVTITIHPVADPPVAVDDYVTTDADQALTVDLTGNDLEIEGQPLTITALGTPAHGTAALAAGKLLYTPAAGFTGVDAFTYTISDSDGLTATATAHVGVGQFPPGAPLETLLALSLDTSDAHNAPSTSSDGRFVAFVTNVALDPADTNGGADIYLYDRGDRSVTWMSRASAGGGSNGPSRSPQISANGRFVVFESVANQLVPGDTNSAADVFRHDRITGDTVRISVATGGGQASGTSGDASISDDGNRVVFGSTAFNLVANDANGASDIFLRDVTAGTTTRISVSVTGGDGDLKSVAPVISGDGRIVAFTSSATNLTAGDTSLHDDIFVRDLAAGTTTRASVTTTGSEADNNSFGASLSQDGRFVSFLSVATNLVPGGSGTRVYVRDTQAQTTTRPISSSSMERARLSGDGRYLAAESFSGVTLCDRFAAVIQQPPGAGDWTLPSWSRDGHYLVVLGAAGSGTLLVTSNPL